MSRRGSIAHFSFRQGWYLEGKRPREVGHQRLVNVRFEVHSGLKSDIERGPKCARGGDILGDCSAIPGSTGGINDPFAANSPFGAFAGRH